MYGKDSVEVFLCAISDTGFGKNYLAQSQNQKSKVNFYRTSF